VAQDGAREDDSPVKRHGVAQPFLLTWYAPKQGCIVNVIKNINIDFIYMTLFVKFLFY
jgi:hypothetical protein